MASCTLRSGVLTFGYFNVIFSALFVIGACVVHGNGNILYGSAAIMAALISLNIIIGIMAIMIIIGVTTEKKKYMIPFMSMQFTTLIFSIPGFIGYVVAIAAEGRNGPKDFSMLLMVYILFAAIEFLKLKMNYDYYRQLSEPKTNIYAIEEFSMLKKNIEAEFSEKKV